MFLNFIIYFLKNYIFVKKFWVVWATCKKWPTFGPIWVVTWLPWSTVLRLLIGWKLKNIISILTRSRSWWIFDSFYFNFSDPIGLICAFDRLIIVRIYPPLVKLNLVSTLFFMFPFSLYALSKNIYRRQKSKKMEKYLSLFSADLFEMILKMKFKFQNAI